jgi:hypothetical protein
VYEGAKSGSAKRLAALIAVLAGLVAGATLWAIPPTVGSAYPQCIFNRLTGLYCPGCGGTRAAYLLLHGQFLDAIRANALVIATTPLLIWCGFALIRFALSGSWRAPRLGGRVASVAIVLVVLLFGIVRNLPGFGFLDPVPLSTKLR